MEKEAAKRGRERRKKRKSYFLLLRERSRSENFIFLFFPLSHRRPGSSEQVPVFFSLAGDFFPSLFSTLARRALSSLAAEKKAPRTRERDRNSKSRPFDPSFFDLRRLFFRSLSDLLPRKGKKQSLSLSPLPSRSESATPHAAPTVTAL